LGETQPQRRLHRSIRAVLAGLIAIIVLSTATDALLRAIGVFPPWGRPMSGALFRLAAAYRIAYSVAGCYLAARLAPGRPMRHALVLGAIGLAVSTAGALATWNEGPAFGPKWYPLSLVVTAMPCAWAGGWLFARSDVSRTGGS
jgi:hypothetical protein